jgi:hypothetical protein
MVELAARILEAVDAWAPGRDRGRLADEIAAGERALAALGEPASAAALRAAVMAARAIDTPESAPVVAVLAVEAEVHAAGDCAMVEAMRYVQRRCADHVRGCIEPFALP